MPANFLEQSLKASEIPSSLKKSLLADLATMDFAQELKVDRYVGNPANMWGVEWRSFTLITLVCLALFSSPTSVAGWGIFGVDFFRCEVFYRTYRGCLGTGVYAIQTGNIDSINADCCKHLKEIDKECVPGFLKWGSPFRLPVVKKRCAKFGPDF
ncbi:hypothetical protein RHMOL_Rhmol03G0287500 [Rhododendron molle]|uniref:Uncharacterized protein n=1 Tax=Rhododendron molle TaxID=49168 RepID=A0ACC0PKT4_RHOML|nr:hypothetical protein RHMOL_Rhmol03G0287500 [Rhododendron molle]